MNISHNRQEAERLKKNVHLIFSLSDAGSLKVALSELGKRQENEVLAFNDLFSVGPIQQLLSEDGRRQRLHWMTDRFSHYHLDSLFNRDHRLETMMDTISKIPENKSITVWCANNAHDQFGLRLAAYLLRNRQQPFRVVNATDMAKQFVPTIDENSAFAQGLIDRETFREIVNRFEQAPLVDSGQQMRYEKEWLELSGQEHVLRLWQKGEIEGVPENELDALIMAAINTLQTEETTIGGYVKAGRVIARVFENLYQLVGDRFLEYRLWRLISDGILGFSGLPGELYKFSVRIL